MTITIDLSPEMESKLLAHAAATGKDVSTLVREAIEEKIQSQQGTRKEEASAPLPEGPREGSSRPSPEGERGEGCLPEQLRNWVSEQFPEDEILRSLDELNEQGCLELSGFLDLSELEEAASREQAQRQR